MLKTETDLLELTHNCFLENLPIITLNPVPVLPPHTHTNLDKSLSLSKIVH